LAQANERYDMIVVDAFVHTAIPRDVKSVEAFRTYVAHLKPNGVAAMNIISAYNGRGAHIVREAQAAAMQSFAAVDLFLAGRGYSLWLPQNFVLVAQKQSGLHLDEYLRYDIEPLRDVRPVEALHDEA
jgi:spermidine synthase